MSQQPNINARQDGFAHMAIILVIVVAVIGASGYFVYTRSKEADSKKSPVTTTEAKSVLVEDLKSAEVPATATEATTKSTNTEKPTPTPAPATTTAAASDALPHGAPTMSRNCILSDSTATHSVSSGKTTLQLLKNNWYTSTAKFAAAVEFAGLTSEVNADQTTVFAVNDYVWENTLTKAQKDYLNASPAHMRAMLVWQIAHQCYPWSDIVSVQTAEFAITTMGGLAYIDPSGHGKLNSSEAAIWDFYSDNGVVNIFTSLVKPPTL